MPEPPDGPDSLEGLAFQLILQKLTTLERAMASMPPLLKKIIDHLEAQTKQPEVEMASYAQLYPELPQDEASPPTLPDVRAADALPPLPPPGRWWRWFLKEGPRA
jgi:hypothetical protein